MLVGRVEVPVADGLRAVRRGRRLLRRRSSCCVPSGQARSPAPFQLLAVQVGARAPATTVVVHAVPRCGEIASGRTSERRRSVGSCGYWLLLNVELQGVPIARRCCCCRCRCGFSCFCTGWEGTLAIGCGQSCASFCDVCYSAPGWPCARVGWCNCGYNCDASRKGSACAQSVAATAASGCAAGAVCARGGGRYQLLLRRQAAELDLVLRGGARRCRGCNTAARAASYNCGRFWCPVAR